MMTNARIIWNSVLNNMFDWNRVIPIYESVITSNHQVMINNIRKKYLKTEFKKASDVDSDMHLLDLIINYVQPPVRIQSHNWEREKNGVLDRAMFLPKRQKPFPTIMEPSKSTLSPKCIWSFVLEVSEFYRIMRNQAIKRSNPTEKKDIVRTDRWRYRTQGRGGDCRGHRSSRTWSSPRRRWSFADGCSSAAHPTPPPPSAAPAGGNRCGDDGCPLPPPPPPPDSPRRTPSCS